MAELTGFTENHVNTAIYLFIDSQWLDMIKRFVFIEVLGGKFDLSFYLL